MVSIKDIYWLAGMLEGEASFYTYIKVNKNSTTSYPEITFQSNDCDIVMRISNILNSTVSRVYARDSKKTTAYKVRVCSTKAIQWMMTIYPIMGQRRQAKLREVIANWKLSVDGRKKEGGEYRTLKAHRDIRIKKVTEYIPCKNPFLSEAQ